MYVTYVCLFVFCSIDKRVVQIKKYSGLKFVNMLGAGGGVANAAGAVLQTPHFRYAVRSFQFHLIKINQNRGNAGNLWSHMTQRDVGSGTWTQVLQIGHDALCLFFVNFFFLFLNCTLPSRNL